MGIPKEPDLEWTPHLAHLIGSLKGDGWVGAVSDGQYLIVFEVTDPEFADAVREELQIIGLSPRCDRRERKPGWSTLYRVKASSMYFVYWYEGLTLDDIRALSEDWGLASAFVRGFYEAEGSYRPTHRSLLFTNTDYELLGVVADLMSSLEFRTTISQYPIPTGGKVPQCQMHVLGGRAEHERFFRVIHPCIKLGTSLNDDHNAHRRVEWLRSHRQAVNENL